MEPWTEPTPPAPNEGHDDVADHDDAATMMPKEGIVRRQWSYECTVTVRGNVAEERSNSCADRKSPFSDCRSMWVQPVRES